MPRRECDECQQLLVGVAQELNQQHRHPLNMADWYATKGDGLCGYYAFVSSLSAARGTPALPLLSLAVRTLQHPSVSATLAVKMLLMMQHLHANMPGMAASACWCSVADLLELAALHSLSLTVWIDAHHVAATTHPLEPATVLPYRHNWSQGMHVHIALYANHFCHMREAPDCTVWPPLPHARCIDVSVGRGVQPAHLHESILRTDHHELRNHVGGMMQMHLKDAPTSSTAATDDTPTTSVPGHTIATAAAQRWTGVGALVRLLQHEIPPREIALDRKTAQLWRNTLEYVIKNMSTGHGGATTKQIKLKLAKAINGASRADSLKYPSEAPLSVLELLHIANCLHMPLVIWRSPQQDANRTMCACVLHACSATAAAVPWHYVQHVAHIGQNLVRIEAPIPLTPSLQQQVMARSNAYADLHPQPRLHHLSAASPHTIAHQHHLCHREPDAAKHVVQPTIPHLRQVPSSRGTRHSQRRNAGAPLQPSEHPHLRHLPLSAEWLRHPDLANCDPEVLVHYWQHRDYNQYAHILYHDTVAGKGEAGLCASTFIPRGVKIAPYLGITKSRRHSREYTATALDNTIDAADIYCDYGYQLFATQPSTLAPPNVARYANSLRTAQRHTMHYNARLEISESAGFGTLWLYATADIMPGTEILCDYGEHFALPTASPQKSTPLSPSQQCESGILHDLSGTSTGTLVDSVHLQLPRRQQHPRQSKRAAPASPLPRRRSVPIIVTAGPQQSLHGKILMMSSRHNHNT